MSYRRMALRIDSEFFSLSNLAEWTPTTTSSLEYFFSSLARSGMMWRQLMQQRVQKSRSTTLPFNSLRESGLPVLSQAIPPSSSGALGVLRVGVVSASSCGFGRALPTFSSAWAVSPVVSRVPMASATPRAMARPRPTITGSQRVRTGLGAAGWDMRDSEPQRKDREYLTLQGHGREHGFRRWPDVDCFAAVTAGEQLWKRLS